MPDHYADSVFRPRTAEELREEFQRLHEAGHELARLPLQKLLEPLDRLARLWHPGSSPYTDARKLLAGMFCPRAIEAALESLAYGLSAPALLGELKRELGRADLMDSWEIDEAGVSCVRGYPLGVVAQVLAGNVFLGGVVALAQSLLTRNAVLLKLSREDSGFTALFAKTLHEADEEGALSRAWSVCLWDSQQEELNKVVRAEADAVVVWGGAAAIAAYPAHACRGRVIHYGPRLGIGLVLADAESQGSGVRRQNSFHPPSFILHPFLKALAWDVALWEQKACSSPRLLLVEDTNGSGDLPRYVAGALNQALGEICEPLPARPLSLDEKGEVLSVRELSWWTEGAEVYTPSIGHRAPADTGVSNVLNSMSHTVLLTSRIPNAIPVGYRSVVVVPLPRLSALTDLLQPYRDFLQTAVLAAPAGRWPEAVTTLVQSGLTQVSAAGAASARVLGLPHEGEFALRRLVRLVGIDLGAGQLAYPDRDPASQAAISAALRDGQ
jgi:hypothetical protein